MKLKQILDSLDIGADYISLREVHNKSIAMVVRNELVEGITSSEDHGLMIEVMVKGQFAYGATNSMELSEIKKVALQAYDKALRTSRYILTPFYFKGATSDSRRVFFPKP